MNIHGAVKNTTFEKNIAQLATGEAMGGMMYYALARIASHYGLDDVAAEFVELGNQETNHAGFYATLGGKYPIDKTAFWRMVKGLSKAECKGEGNILKLAEALAAGGVPEEAVSEMKTFAEQEKHHGEVTRAILAKYAPEMLEETPGVKKYVCPLCGFEHEGELDDLPDGWKCPICGVAKAAFNPME